MNEQPQPYFRTDYVIPPRGPNFVTPEEERAEHHAAVAAASREASQREAAYLRALGRPRVATPELPPIKEPVLPLDFGTQVADLDEKIFNRGVAVSSDNLLEEGKQRFQQLLELDRKAPRGSHGAGIDLTSFPSVQSALHAFESSVVPARKNREQSEGTGKEREAARKITDFVDLWKNTSERREVIDDIYAFRDAFESLLFGQSMFEKLSKDGRLRSPFLTGGKGRRVDLFRDWFTVMEGTLTSVTLVQPLWSLFAWLANEQSQPPTTLGLTRDFFNVRAPTAQQVRLTGEVLDGYLLGYREWELWQHVGRRTRGMPDESRLASWRKALAARCPRITSWHEELRAAFYRDIGYGFESYRQFEADRHRGFLDRTVQKLLDCMSVLLALGVNETFPGSVAAWFEGSVLVSGKHKLRDKRTSIKRQLAAAFPAATFQLDVEEVA